MAALPYMQLYVAEYLADTQHLNAEQHGAYMLLLMNYWTRGKALMDSDERLAAIARTELSVWRERVRPALEEYFVIAEGQWVHSRVERDLDAVNQKCEKARESRSRRNERSTNVPTNVPTNVLPIEEKREEEKREKTLRASRAECELVYLAYPRKVGKDDALKAIARATERVVAGADMPPMSLPEALAYLRSRAETFARSPAGQQGEYTPHPATWFNKGRYLDNDKEWHGTDKQKSRGSRNRADEALDELRKAGVEIPFGAAEDCAGEVRASPWRSDGRDPPGVVLEGTR